MGAPLRPATARLVASDLDGTLLLDGFPPRVSPRVRAALDDVQAAGIVVVLVTARSWRTMRSIAELAGVTGLVVCSNGAVVYDPVAGEVHRSHPVELAVLRDFIARCRTASPDVCFAWETAGGAYRDARYHAIAPVPLALADAYRDVEVVEEIADDHEVTKLLVRHEGMSVPDLLASLEAVAHDGVTITVSGGPFVEVMAAGVTKAFALEQLCAELAISADEVVAVGDQPNDLPMLRWAGRGVAMGNAHPAVLAEIDEVTSTNEEDGLALVLESLLVPPGEAPAERADVGTQLGR